MKKQKSGCGTILIIEDDYDLLWMLEKLLRMEGFNVLSALNAADGIEKFSRNKGDISVILLDLSLPDRDGEEIVRDIRGQGAQKPIIITTGWEDRNQFKRLKELGIQTILVKPFDLNLLVEKINQLIS